MKQSTESYYGVIVPMITPLTAEGKIDKPSAVKLINFLLDNHTTPFVLGTTGEAALIPVHEREVLINILLENRRKDIPVITGVIGLNLVETIEKANKYFKNGVDAVVVTLPYYFELTEYQIFNYYNTLSQHIRGDIIMYNIPKTVHQSIPVSVIDELSHNENIIGIKDSEHDLKRLEYSASLWNNRNDFFHIIGVNSNMLKGLILGSKGIVPSTANIVPHLYTDLFRFCQEGKIKEAGEIHKKTIKWSNLYQDGKTLGESLAALKLVMYEMDLCQSHMMPPLTSINGEEGAKLVKAVRMAIKYSNHL